MYPEATIPVVQLSVQSQKNGQYHWEMGQDNIVVIDSGSATHNLREFRHHGKDAL